MDFFIQLIVFVIREILKGTEPNRPPGNQAAVRTAARTSQPRAPAIAPRTKTVVQSPVDDGEGWRTALTLLGLIALVVIVAAWAVYMLSLSGG